ncbi:uncharacterized protein LOC124167144 [Ischnura elegans]|uniref:uncharacterized protein LOC124167144 n=1 Tax=Ischnura elegans TaxID=197161 RepID=UPI001ED87AB6|nr:uncharacterized protein LOC124167144 [Ischnura elegans]XP_046400902.1 uncharacterized protein LOC124167144 [Ischnura elegans]
MINFLLPKKRMETSDSRFKKRMQLESEKVFKIQQCAVRVFKAYLGQPRKVVRLLVFIACSITVLFQLAQCFKKLTDPPISTHSKLLINTTMSYPSITICRSPGYRLDVIKKYGLGSSLRWTSEWKNFPFGNTTLTDFWSEATYTDKDILSVYGLNGRPPNIDVKSHMSYFGGQCHTLVPLVETYSSGSTAGYSLILKHTDPNEEGAGWLFYIHEAKEIWTETGPQFSGMYEVIWMKADEQIDLKIVAHHIKTISQKDRICVNKRSYSEGKCKSLCRWRLLAGLVGCTGPWITPNGVAGKQKLGVKECNTYEDTRELIKQYLLLTGLSSYTSLGYNGENETEISANAFACQRTCHRKCHETQYTSFLVNRKPFSGTVDFRNGFIAPLNWARSNGNDREGTLDESSRDDVMNRVSSGSSMERMDCDGSGNCSGRFGRVNSTKNSSLGSRVFCDNSSDCGAEVAMAQATEGGENLVESSQRRDTAGKSSVSGNVSAIADATVAYSGLMVYYANKVVSSMEEHWGYDFTQFVADAGGSLGFILGMSVVGAVAILEQLAETLVEAISGPKETLREKDAQRTGEEGIPIKSVVPYEGMKY